MEIHGLSNHWVARLMQESTAPRNLGIIPAGKLMCDYDPEPCADYRENHGLYSGIIVGEIWQ